MVRLQAADERHIIEQSTRRSWIAVALTPVGVVTGLVVAYAVAAAMGVTLDPATGPGPSGTERAVVFSIAGVVWLTAPVVAVVLALRPARSGSRSGITALVFGAVLVVAMVALTVANLI